MPPASERAHVGIPYLAGKGDNEVRHKEIEKQELEASNKTIKHRNGRDCPEVGNPTERTKERNKQYDKKESPLVTEARSAK